MEQREIDFDFELSTIRGIREFRDIKDDMVRLYPNIPMSAAREYIKTGKKLPIIPDEFYEIAEKLYEKRIEVIESVKIQISEQARKNEIDVPEEYLSGKNLAPFFENDIYEKVPDLKVFEFLRFYSPEEIAQMTKKQELVADQKNTEDER